MVCDVFDLPVFFFLLADLFSAVAVSGGSDSMALSHLAIEWTQRTSPSSPVYAFTVDHRFRSESAAEADLVHQWLDNEKNKIHHRTLIIDWKDAVPPPGQKQSRGREERLKLLTTECERVKCKYLLTAHQREDQLDTFLMRLGRQRYIVCFLASSLLLVFLQFFLLIFVFV